MTTGEIKETLNQLGFSLNDKGSYWQTKALWRGGDNPTAIQIYKDTGVWRDYVEGTPPKPFQALISKVLKTNDRTILSKYTINEIKRADIFENIEKKDTIVVEKTYDKKVLDSLLPHYKFYLDKGISKETLKLYKSGFDTAGKLNNRYVFPIFRFQDPDTLIGFSGRSMIPDLRDNKIPKWKHIGTKKNWVYPLCLDRSFEESIENTGEIYLVESVGDSLALTENNMKNHLVIFGLDLSSKQIMSILSLSPKKIIISMNNDESGIGMKAAIRHYVSLLDFFDIEKLEIKLPQQNDLSDMHKDGVFNDWVNKKVNQTKQQKYILNFLRDKGNKRSFPQKANIENKIKLIAAHLNEDIF